MGNINDDLCVLGLGFTSAVDHKSSTKSAPPPPRSHHEPSLTLSLFGETIKKVEFDYIKVCSNDDVYRQDSGASSLSNVSVKRERDGGSEEAETERVSSRVSDEDDDGSNGRKKLRLTKAQSALLEESFKLHSTLKPKQKQDLARELKLRPRQVEVWFQNRRARSANDKI